MIAGLLLAAGESTRMGSPKPLLDWHGRPLVRYQAEQLRKGGCDLVVIVLGYRADRVLPFVDGLTGTRVVVNPDYRQGRATSVRAGATMIPSGVDWILDLGVDQPRPANAVREVVKALTGSTAAIVIPTYCGRHGHPTAFAGRLLAEIREVQDATLGLRAVVQRHEKEIQQIEASSAAVLLDVNTADEYVTAVGAR